MVPRCATFRSRVVARALPRVGDKLVQQELIYEKLPADIAERHVLLLDPILATGNSAARAIQVPPRAGACGAGPRRQWVSWADWPGSQPRIHWRARALEQGPSLRVLRAGVVVRDGAAVCTDV
jgi:hypothetical protein